MLRRRKKAVQVVKSLDAFRKTSEECIEKTTTGGTFSVLSLVVIVWLMVMELIYFMETTFTYSFNPDTDFTQKLKINVDITVAMPCRYVGADVLDQTGQQVMSFGNLEMEDTWWELDPEQRIHFDGMRRVNSYFREQFHSLHQLLWRSGYINIFGEFPRRRVFPSREKDACQVVGSLEINKVAGNFHITAGKTIPLPRGHAHLAVFMDDRDYNFTHRINRLSFGDPAPGIVHPLEGDEEVADKNLMSYQYFITVVPTYVNTYSYRGSTFQYSVSEQAREISHEKDSHGTPGIFFKYDVSALRVDVNERHEPLLSFLVRLCGIVGGVMTCSGLMSAIISLAVSCFTCRYFRGGDAGKHKPQGQASQQATTPLLLTAEVLQTETHPLLASSNTNTSNTTTNASPTSTTGSVPSNVVLLSDAAPLNSS